MSTQLENKESDVSLIKIFASKYSVEAEKLTKTLKSTVFNTKDGVSTEQLMMLLVVANQYDLNPFTKEIYAYPDKGGVVPVVGIDGWIKIRNSQHNYGGVQFKFSDETIEKDGKALPAWCEATIFYKDEKVKPLTIREYTDECYRSTSYKSPWQSHPRRMLQHKAHIQAIRNAFGISGIYDPDESEHIKESQSYDVRGDVKVLPYTTNQNVSYDCKADEILAEIEEGETENAN